MITNPFRLSCYFRDQFSQETKSPGKHKIPLKEFLKIMEIFIFNRQANTFPIKEKNHRDQMLP